METNAIALADSPADEVHLENGSTNDGCVCWNILAAIYRNMGSMTNIIQPLPGGPRRLPKQGKVCSE